MKRKFQPFRLLASSAAILSASAVIAACGFHAVPVLASSLWGDSAGDVEAPAAEGGDVEAPAAEAAPAAEDPNNHPEPDPALTEGDTMENQGTLKPSSNEGTSAFSKVKDTSLDELMDQIQSNIPAGNGQWACYVCDLSQGTEGSFGNAQMQSASLIKLYIMGAVYESYETLAGTYGAAALDSLLNPMITVSDNDAANTLTSYLGGGDSTAGMAAVNSWCAEHGYTSTHMGRLLLHSNEFDDNYTSVEDCGHLLREIYEVTNGTKTDSTLAHCDAMYDLLKQQQHRNKIPAQMPAGVKVANKTGELGDVENDAGIIYDTGKTDCVIIFMSQNLSAVGYAQQAIASNSAAIYHYFNG